MRTTLNIDDILLRDAMKATGVREKTKLVHLGLEELVHDAAYKRLAQLRGTVKDASAAPRKRYGPSR